MAGQEDPVQREIHWDQASWECIELITSSLENIADFLNSFKTCYPEGEADSAGAEDVTEARVTKGETVT